jgi:twitching motility protein PilI
MNSIVVESAVTPAPGFMPAPPMLMTPLQALTTVFELPLEPVAAASTPSRRAAEAAAAVELRQGIRIGELNLMIRYEDGSELTELPSVFRLPNAPPWFHGMTNLHGALIPVFGLDEYLGQARAVESNAKPGATRMLLVMGSGADAAGVVIDGLPQRLRVREDQRADDAPVPAWMDFKPADLFNRLEAELSQLQ